MKFVKMEGAGNDYVYVNGFEETLPEPPETLAPKISDRHFGVGSDGVVLILPSEKADARMRMFNSDGSESEMCGNAIRCVAKFVHDYRLAPSAGTRLTIETLRGVLTLDSEVRDGRVERVQVDMGEPILAPEKVPTLLRSRSGEPNGPVVGVPLTRDGRDFEVTCVSMGNPHAVVFVEGEPSDADVFGLGPILEKDPCFPRRTNVEFAQIVSKSEIRMRVWERGTGETLACGTGACATAVAAVLNNRTDRRVTLRLTGGELEIEWRESDNHVLMTGPAREVFHGVWD